MHILDSFFRRGFQKAVIARKTTLNFEKAINIAPILSHLLHFKTNANFFALIISPSEAFFGITPETLFIKQGRSLFTEALAGTKTTSSKETLFNPKELKEFHLTRNFILDTISPISKNVLFDPKVQIKKTANLLHLHTNIKATLNQSASIRDLIKTLHPTPALAGFPRNKALNFLYDSEPFDRGLYAAPFCFTTNNKSHCLIAIRSALLKDNQLHLFSGSGCVQGSSAPKEWQELNDKIAPYLTQFTFTKVTN